MQYLKISNSLLHLLRSSEIGSGPVMVYVSARAFALQVMLLHAMCFTSLHLLACTGGTAGAAWGAVFIAVGGIAVSVPGSDGCFRSHGEKCNTLEGFLPLFLNKFPNL